MPKDNVGWFDKSVNGHFILKIVLSKNTGNGYGFLIFCKFIYLIKIIYGSNGFRK